MLQKPYAIADLLERLRALGAARAGVPLAHAAPAPTAIAAAPRDEAARLRVIFELALHEPSPSGALGAFVNRVAAIFDVPIALVTVVLQDRQLSHATCGLPERLDTPRKDSFCTHAVVARAALVVQDALENPLFADNPLVKERGFRFYAGVPLFERFGRALGTLCIIDSKPRVFGYFDLELLSLLAKRVMAELEWRERRARSGAPLAAFRHLSYMDEELGIMGRDAFVEALQVESLRAADGSHPLSLLAVGVAPEALVATASALGARFPAAHLGRLAAARLGVIARVPPGKARAGAVAAAGTTGRVAAAEVPRMLGGADALLWDVEEELQGYGVAPPDAR